MTDAPPARDLKVRIHPKLVVLLKRVRFLKGRTATVNQQVTDALCAHFGVNPAEYPVPPPTLDRKAAARLCQRRRCEEPRARGKECAAHAAERAAQASALALKRAPIGSLLEGRGFLKKKLEPRPIPIPTVAPTAVQPPVKVRVRQHRPAGSPCTVCEAPSVGRGRCQRHMDEWKARLRENAAKARAGRNVVAAQVSAPQMES